MPAHLPNQGPPGTDSEAALSEDETKKTSNLLGQENLGPVTLGPAAVAALYHRHASELRRMVYGVVRDADLAEEVVQAAFAKAVERGGPDRPESARDWLFRVAVNEALLVRRRQRVAWRARQRMARDGNATDLEHPADPIARDEAVQRVREVLGQLPAALQQVVRARVYEGKRFAEIAADLKAPLGTVLTRMRRAMDQLRSSLQDLK